MVSFFLHYCFWKFGFQFFLLDNSFRDIKTTRGKFKRAVLQFTPESWIKVDWYKNCAIRRTLTIYSFVMIWLVRVFGFKTLGCTKVLLNNNCSCHALLFKVSELNTFFLKHIFAVDTSHPLVSFRLALISFISAPTIRLIIVLLLSQINKIFVRNSRNKFVEYFYRRKWFNWRTEC